VDGLFVIGRDEVRARLTYELCIPLVRKAMIALSSGRAQQLLRSVLDLEDARAFGVMPGAMGPGEVFGAKLISVYPENFAQGRQSHQGVVAIFDPKTGAPAAIVHAGEVTAIRTAAASAVATDALARPEATRMAVLGYGEQAESHIAAISRVRRLEAVTIWGRSAEKAAAFAERASKRHGLKVEPAAGAREAVEEADIVCTVTAASEPILRGAWLKPGTHVNLVGSSRPGPVEADDDLVVRARLFADHRPSVLAQGAEILRAKAAGLIDDNHVLGEIGEVLSGVLPGRRSAEELTVYKSLGSIVQDLASAWTLYRQALQDPSRAPIPF
jgi:ornithine cyclodeaminase